MYVDLVCTLPGLKQYYKLVQSDPLPHKVFEAKVEHLLELFSKIPFNQALVFSNLHTRAQHLADILSSKGLPAACISGGLSQDQRLEAMSKLKQYQCRVLISTDLTSRGIDADKVNLVINLDVPQDWETYMHRIGRAGRFGTQGLAVTYCCHGEEENKMMAIAQKCSLRLSMLPSTIEPGLMDEQCDWDVCTEASTPGPLPQLSSRTEKKKKQHAKSVPDHTLEHSSQRKPEKTHPAPRLGAHDECNLRRASPAKDTLPHGPPLAVPTRKEQQDALPKISPLSSFKNYRSRFLAFEEAERDYHSFITTGLGRLVEVFREFRGGEDGDPKGHRESFTLNDDGGQSLKQNRKQWKSNISPPRSVSGSSNSQSDEDDETNQTRGRKYRAITEPQTEARETPSPSKPKAETTRSNVCTSSAPKMYRQRTCASSARVSSQPEIYDSIPIVKSSRHPSQTAPAHTDRNESRKIKQKTVDQSKKISEKMNREQKRERDEGEHDDDDDDDHDHDEEEWSAETYWRASYRAWNDYYASMSPFQEQNYQSYYGVAHNWMAAYRMNAVYMEELLKH
ncbi:hypothetical protein PFLUV_G00057670 [Perca fluviatilis]|uniref:Helicase C-terminal domain-containing protein n=2 Tax=Perca fluviatilis TaxID=8168 RepID=A0A6A5FMB0_PERFL|nr:hypothetical protein PFLUV_G00057670 [Perca fluviatilis]